MVEVQQRDGEPPRAVGPTSEDVGATAQAESDVPRLQHRARSGHVRGARSPQVRRRTGDLLDTLGNRLVAAGDEYGTVVEQGHQATEVTADAGILEQLLELLGSPTAVPHASPPRPVRRADSTPGTEPCLYHKCGVSPVPPCSYAVAMSGYAKERGRQRIVALAGRGMDLATFWHECTEALTPAVPHYLSPCWFTLDPASLLVTSHFQEGLAEIPHEWLAQEYYADDFNKMADVARSERGMATLHEATDGDPSRSARYREVMAPYGGEQELLAGLRTPSGEVWGVLGLYREVGAPIFEASDFEFVASVAPALAAGARRALLIGEAIDPDGLHGPGLLVLTDRWEVESMTAGVAEWLRELPDGDWDSGRLPSVVAAVAGQALRTSSGEDAPGEVAFARVMTRAGRWIVLHGAALVTDGPRRAAVIIEPAHPTRLMPLLMSAYQLTDRERAVTRLVLQGDSTTDIAASLFISPHTVQQHLKSVFTKTGVSSRRDLIGKIFFAHYEPRVRDNEARALTGRPLRGGPAPRRDES